jgi:transcriptional regulator with XRE-family HTH domain
MPCYNKYGERVAIERAKLYQYLGANVYRLRKQRGLTQSELAAYIGCNQKYISQIETGAAKASVSICYKIANTFSVSVDSLFTDPEKCVNAGENTSDREFAESITRTIIQYLDTIITTGRAGGLH